MIIMNFKSKYFDRELKDERKLNQPLKLSLDTNLQYIINEELNRH